jgi:hypothetical protein
MVRAAPGISRRRQPVTPGRWKERDMFFLVLIVIIAVLMLIVVPRMRRKR